MDTSIRRLRGAVVALLLLAPIIASAADVFPRFRALPFIVQDAEYSRSLDRIVIVSVTPRKQLHILKPANGAVRSVNLPLPPSSVSVSPDGKFAAVGHNGWISYVDLESATLLDTFEVSADVLDVVLAGNGYVYAFPRENQWTTIFCIELATGAETTSGGYSIYAGTVGKLHPGGEAIYGADNGLSPSDIEKYDITQGTANLVYDSPYHGDYAMCGDLWMSRDGLRIFTRCGNVFRSSTDRSRDMTYNGSLSEVDLIEFLDHSMSRGKIALIPANNYWGGADADSELQLYDYEFLAFDRRFSLPAFDVGGSPFAAHGRFAFFSRDGSVVHVIAMADPTSALLYDNGVMSIPLDANIAGNKAGLFFGDVSVGDRATRPLTIANTGASDLEVQDVSIGAGPFTALGLDLPVTLAPMESMRIRVRFRPSDAQKFTQQLTVLTNDPDRPEKNFELSGSGIAPPAGGF